MENFFGLLKSELLYLEEFTSYEDFINKLRVYTCPRKWVQISFGSGLSFFYIY